jgi:hypothetical protein
MHRIQALTSVNIYEQFSRFISIPAVHISFLAFCGVLFGITLSR